METFLERYQKIVGESEIKQLKELANECDHKRILVINSTKVGGGVAELLNAYIPFFNKLGLKVEWKILEASTDFFIVTKKIHNALQGKEIDLDEREWELYFNQNERFSRKINVNDYDLVIIHDPQPLPLAMYFKSQNKDLPIIWRIHIDLSNPYLPIWSIIKELSKEIDWIVVSCKEYLNYSFDDKNVEIIMPAIDPLSPKNIELDKNYCDFLLNKYGINVNKPFIAQVSRYDIWKDPEGVIEIFDRVKEKHKDLQLVLLGNKADDDPEFEEVFNKVEKRKEKSPYKEDIFLLTENNDYLVNAVQRRAFVIIQKSIREGFGLVVSEAMYKKNVVIASEVGGIKHQIEDGINGFLLDPFDYEGFSEKISLILNNPKLKEKIGKEAYLKVKNNFLITRLVKDWLYLFKKIQS